MRSVRQLQAVPNLLGHRIDLRWQNPPASEFSPGPGLAGIRIVRRQRTFPLTVNDGEVVYPLNYQPAGVQLGPVVSRFSDRPPTVLQTYYYTVFAADGGGQFYSDENSQASAIAASDYVIDGENLVERLYKMLPAIHQRYDRLSPSELGQLPPEALVALNNLPAALSSRGPLRRFLHAAGSGLNVMRSLAEVLPDLHNADLAPPDFLLPLAGWIGWELDRTLPVFAQRNEIKFAPRLYKSVGTVSNLRNIVNRYTGLYSQVAEFTQHLACSNMPPQFNLFAIAETGAGWIGTDDAATILGLVTPESGILGTAAAAAALLSTNSEPFSLRPGMEMSITADNRIPVTVRFEVGDFANINAATASEVCAVINRTMSEVTAARVGARVQITSNTIGETSSLRIERYLASLISLESAPRGRLSSFVDQTLLTPPRLRLFYEINDPLAFASEQAARQSLNGEKFARGFLSQEQDDEDTVLPEAVTRDNWRSMIPQNTIRYKTFRQGNWGKSFGLPFNFEGAPSSPASTVMTMPDGSRRIFLAWIEKSKALTPSTAAAALGFNAGNDRATGGIAGDLLTPAVLVSANEPFNLTDGMELHLTIDREKPVRIRFRAGDFQNSGIATASGQEVVNVINAYLEEAVAEMTPAGTFTVTTRSAGQKSLIEVENDRISFATGTAQTPLPARLVGQRSAPFEITPGTRLILRGNFSEIQAVHFAAADFANPQQATALEVVNLLNARLTRTTASIQPNGTIRLETLQGGGNERLEIDLQQSTAAAALGFDFGNHTAAGDWGDEIIWGEKHPVITPGGGVLGDLSSLTAAGGVIWLFWSRHSNGLWSIESSRWDGVNWNAPEILAAGEGGNVEPCAVLDSTNRVWLFWSQRSGENIWTLRRRMFNPATLTWGPEAALTALPPGLTTVADREPQAVLLGSGDIRIFFSSDRAGGKALWAINFQPAPQTTGGLAAVTSGPPADCAPSPLLLTNNSLWVFFRSDRSVSLSRAATRQIPAVDNRLTASQTELSNFQSAAQTSVEMIDTGTLRRFSNTTSVVMRNAARNSRLRLWDDLLAYTPQRPRGYPIDSALGQSDLYTRGTVGLYLSQTLPDSPLSQQMVKRLLPALERFLPINVRVVIILAPRVDIEFVYGQGRDINESYSDRYPFIEFYTGLTEEAYRAVMPQVVILRSNTAGDVSANDADLTTLRRRTYFPPPE